MSRVTTDVASLVAAEIVLDPSMKEETDRAFAGCQAEDIRIVAGTAIALVGSGLSLVCAVLLVWRQDWWDRPALGLLASTLVAASGVIVSHAADLRREMHLTTLRTKRPYIVSTEAEAALRRIQSARLELRSLGAPSAGVEKLHSQAWRLIRALDVATPTWRFDDPELTRLRVVQKARRAEHATLIALADQADQLVADAVADAVTTEAGSPEPGGSAEPETVTAVGDREPDPELAEANREAIRSTDPMAVAALIAHGVAPEVGELEPALGRQDHTL